MSTRLLLCSVLLFTACGDKADPDDVGEDADADTDADSDADADADTDADTDTDTDTDTDDTGDCERVTRYEDADGDGFGSEVEDEVCPDEEGWADVSGDCDDTDASVHPDAEETCGEVDADCDGLVGCEDGDCLSAECEEICDDGTDNDADGLEDCEDDDCWGTEGCVVVEATVRSGRFWSRRGQRSQGYQFTSLFFFSYGGGTVTGPSFTYSYGMSASQRSATFRGTGLSGTARRIGPSGTATCSWTLDQLSAWSSGASWGNTTQASGSGFSSTGACGLTLSDLVPRDHTVAFSVSSMLMDDGGDDLVWLRGAPTFSTSTAWSDSDSWTRVVTGSTWGGGWQERRDYYQWWSGEQSTVWSGELGTGSTLWWVE